MTEQPITAKDEEREAAGGAGMSDQDQRTSEVANSEAEERPAAKTAPAEKPKKDPVRKATLIVLALVLILLCYYVVADRLTPYTTQARLHALVVPVAPQVSGLVEEVRVTNNQRVAKNDLLFTINTDNFVLEMDAAEADLESARQAVGASTAAVTAAEASLAAAQAGLWQAEQDALRMRGIRESDPGAISVRRLQYAEAALATAQANVEAAEANLEKARQDLGRAGESNVRVVQARVAIANAQLNIDRSVVRAPDNGVVTDVRLDTGNFAAAGAPQMTFIATDNVWVQADFTENNLAHIEAGAPVEFIFDARPGEVFSGRVRGTGFGVQVDSAPLGSLPTIENDKNWLRDAQRFPVLVDFESERLRELGVRVGSQASVVVYTGDRPLMNLLGKLRIRIATYLSYAY
jgi:multidrug resistance efflux pump